MLLLHLILSRCDKHVTKMVKKNIVFVGILASSDSLEKLKINYGYIAVEQGKVRKCKFIKYIPY